MNMVNIKLVCVLVVGYACVAIAQDPLDAGLKVALKLYEDCKKSDGLSPCLKRKAVTFMDRLGRMEKLSVTDGVTLLRAADAKVDPVLTEEQLDATLPRALEDKDEALTNMVLDRFTKFVGSRTLEVSMPRLIEDEEEYEYENDEARDGKIKIPKLKKLKKLKKKGMMGGLMMMIVGKLVSLIPVAIAGLFLLAGKALITAKVALLLAGIIAVKKLLAAKQGGGGGGGWQSGNTVTHEVVAHDVGHGGGYGGGHGGGWQSGGGGGGGGWQSGGHGGGWDKRSLNAQDLAYSAQKP